MRIIFFFLFILFNAVCADGQTSDLGSKSMERKIRTSEKFHNHLMHLHDSLSKKYSFKEHIFDPECIYDEGDLTKLIQNLLDIGDFKIEKIKEIHDSVAGQINVEVSIEHKKYMFKTSDNDKYVDLPSIMSTLQQLTQDFKPEFQYIPDNLTTGFIFLIFANSSDLRKAIDEGFPCSLESRRWDLNENWEKGFYSDVNVGNLPNLEELRVVYFKTLQDLYHQGYNVQNLTLERIHILDYFDDNRIAIAIDGNTFITPLSNIIDNKVRCFWDGWGTFLAYTLVKKYDGIPVLVEKNEQKTINVTQEEFLKKVEAAFGKRN